MPSLVYDTVPDFSAEITAKLVALLKRAFESETRIESWEILQKGLRGLRKAHQIKITQNDVIGFYLENWQDFDLPEPTSTTLAKVQLKPMRSQSGIHSVSVLTKPFPCPGECIFCPNDVRMPKSYIASEPGAQRAERNSFDPYLQTYNRLLALKRIGHLPTKIEVIVLGGTWSYYPEAYQVWFIKECFRAINDFAEGIDDRATILKHIADSTNSAHRAENRVVDEASIAIDGNDLKQTYNQVISKHYLAPEQLETRSPLPPREHATWEELFQEHTRNEGNTCKCVGLTLETRPDNISEEEVIRLRKLGTTKTQIGFQSLSDSVLEANKRGHDTAATKRAVSLLRQAGFKIHAHWMPNLYGSSLENDLREYDELFASPDYKPDELKIYPCALIPSAELMQYFHAGKWQPYSTEQLKTLLKYVLTHTPEWARLTRVIRDIPSQEVYTDNIKTNLRQMVEEELKKENAIMLDIRSREIRKDTPQLPLELKCTEYKTPVSNEEFWQFVDQENRILGFVRLSLPTIPNFIEELQESAIIRELHVYGQAESVGKKEGSGPQHSGLGTQLLQVAEKSAREKGYTKIAVISAVGTREYYAKRGYTKRALYQSKVLS